LPGQLGVILVSTAQVPRVRARESAQAA
jgi:hypothetical protein